MMRRKITVSDDVWNEIAKRGKFGETEDTVLRRVLDLQPGRGQQGQSRESGARAAKWGRETADKLAEALLAEKVNPNGNEYQLGSERITIRCARSTTNTVGVTYQMLDRIDSVIAALQNDAGSFDLYKISPTEYHEQMRGTKSKGASAGRVGMVRTAYFKNSGELVGTYSID